MINLEIKSPSKKVINQISELICKYKLQDKIVLPPKSIASTICPPLSLNIYIYIG